MIRHAALVVLALAARSDAQITNGPAVCFSFNANTSSIVYSLPLCAGGEIFLGFTAPTTMTIEVIDIYSSGFPTNSVISVEVYQQNGATLGAFLGRGASVPPSAGWIPMFLAAPIPFAAATTYALRLTISANFLFVSGDGTQPVPVSYVLNCGPSPPTLIPPCGSIAPVGTYGARLRFRATACGPTPWAVATQVGLGCGATQSALGTNVPPVLGTTFPFFVTGSFGGGPIQIYWAAGPATTGVNLGIGGGCTTYLDLVSLATLFAAGLEPLATFPVTGIQNVWTVPIPFDPTLAGVTVTTQAVVFHPSGFPAPAGTVLVSNALELTVGY
jgi:hypothetical protein